MKTRINPMLVGLAVLVFSVTRAFAVEGGLGRPISGMSIAPFAGVIPPEPGFLVSVGETYYDGSIGGARSVPRTSTALRLISCNTRARRSMAICATPKATSSSMKRRRRRRRRWTRCGAGCGPSTSGCRGRATQRSTTRRTRTGSSSGRRRPRRSLRAWW